MLQWVSAPRDEEVFFLRSQASGGVGIIETNLLVSVKYTETIQNWCLQTVVPENTPESLLDSKEINPVNLNGNQTWILTGRTDAEAEAPVFWSSDVMSRLIGKVPDAKKDWGQEKSV